MNQYPLVSAICISDDCRYLSNLIDCFQKQTYPNKELIIVNNRFNHLENSELNISSTSNVFVIDTPSRLSSGMARNYGISVSNGQIIAQFDKDSHHHENRIELQVASIARNDAHISVLTSTLQYSSISGRLTYYKNSINAIMGTMVFIRPKDIDYQNVDKNEEKYMFDSLVGAGFKAISLDMPVLMCKIISSKHHETREIRSHVSEEDMKYMQAIIKSM